ncbi:MAG: hypothetical protein ACE5GO_10620, partial [Anaerolineales bacterium]
RASEGITSATLMDDLSKVYASPDLAPGQDVLSLVGREDIDALLAGNEVELYFDPDNPYEYLHIIAPQLLQVGGEPPEQTATFTNASFFGDYQVNILYDPGRHQADGLAPIYLLFAGGVTFLLDGAIIEYSPDRGLRIELTPDERQILTGTPGYHQIEKTLEIRVDDPRVDPAVADHFDGPPTITYSLVVENVVPTGKIMMPNGKSFGPANLHLLFDDPEGTVSLALPEIPPGDVAGIVTVFDDLETYYAAGVDFTVSDDGEGGSILTIPVENFIEGQYNQWTIVAPNDNGASIEGSALATLDDIDFTLEVRGIQFTQTYEPHTFERHVASEIEKIKELGGNYVGIAVSWYMPDIYADEIRPAPSTWHDGQFGITHSETALRKFANEAHSRGMRADLALHLACDYWDCWTGALSSSDQEAWDQAYIAYAVEMASLAQELGIERLLIINELESTQKREAFMLRLIDEVRAVYDGHIIINLSLWGDGEFGSSDYRETPLSVLRAVDFVGLNLYVSGAAHNNASVDEMVARMIPQMDSVADYYRSIGISNLTITEAGVAWIDGGAIIPWEYRYPEDAEVDTQEQADYYLAYHQALENSKLGTMVTGVMHWSWTIIWPAMEEDQLGWAVLSIARNPLVHEVLAELWVR